MHKRGGPKVTTFKEALRRHWSIIVALQGASRGLTAAELARRTEIPRSTLYRYLAVLERAGIPMTTNTVNGEARHRLMAASELPALDLSSLQIAALHLARTELDHLAGSSLVAEIDQLLSKLRPVEPQTAFSFTRNGTSAPAILSVIERALAQKRRLRLSYRSRAGGGKTEEVRVDPTMLHVADRTPYVHGFCIERGAARTYRLSRIESAEITLDAATNGGQAAGAEAFRRSRKGWSGVTITVRIRLDRDVAHLARDYPLAIDQNERPEPDGTLVVEARVAASLEALPWILGWGASAEVLEPTELRALVTEQLAGALGRYAAPPVRKASRKKNGPGITRRPTGVRPGARRVGS